MLMLAFTLYNFYILVGHGFMNYDVQVLVECISIVCAGMCDLPSVKTAWRIKLTSGMEFLSALAAFNVKFFPYSALG